MRIAKLFVALTIASMLPLIAAAQQSQAPPQAAPSTAAPAPVNYFTIKPLGHNVFAAIAVPGSGAGSNAGFVIGDDGVAVIDTFQKVDAAKSLLAEIRKKMFAIGFTRKIKSFMVRILPTRKKLPSKRLQARRKFMTRRLIYTSDRSSLTCATNWATRAAIPSFSFPTRT
jgi:hypothetical protein